MLPPILRAIDLPPLVFLVVLAPCFAACAAITAKLSEKSEKKKDPRASKS